MPHESLYELTYSIGLPPARQVLYLNAVSPTEAIVSLIDEHADDMLSTLSSLSIALFNPATGTFDAMKMGPECEAFLAFAQSLI